MKCFFVFLLLYFLSGCNLAIDQPKTEQTTKNNFFSDIPFDKHYRFHEGINYERDRIGALDTLENGYAGYQFRIWYAYHTPRNEYEESDRHVVVIKYQKGWQGELVSSCWKFTPDSAFMVNKWIKRGTPKMGWNPFIDSLVKLGIVSRKDDSQIEGMYKDTGGNTVHFEIATKSLYRFYTITAADELKDQVPEAARVMKILHLVRNQLSFHELPEN